MGAAQYDGRPSPVFAARLDHAVSLYLAGVAPHLVVTGGKADGDRTTEAATRPGLRDRPGRAGVGDPRRGRTAGRRANRSAAVSTLLRDHGLADAVFVSDRPHMLRVLRMARDDGITAWGSPTTTSPIEHDAAGRLDATLHELGALAQYFLAGSTADRSSPPLRPDCRRTDFPLGDRGLAPYTVPKPARIGPPQGPGDTDTQRSRFALPAHREGDP